jgi:hypothetical protein
MTFNLLPVLAYNLTDSDYVLVSGMDSGLNKRNCGRDSDPAVPSLP